MLNLSDKELDRLSREAAEQFEPDEQISSWEKLAPRLDQELGVRSRGIFRKFGRGPLTYAMIIVAVTVISFLYLRPKHSPLNENGAQPQPALASGEKGSISKRTNSGSPDLAHSKLESRGTVAGETRGNSETVPADPEKETSQPNPPSPAAELSTQTANAGEMQGYHDLSKKSTERNSLPRTNDKTVARNSHPEAASFALAGPADVAGKGANRKGKELPGADETSAREAGREISATTTYSTHFATENWDSERIRLSLLGTVAPVADGSAKTSQSALDQSAGNSLQLTRTAMEQSKNTQRTLRMNRALKLGVLYGSDVTSVHSVAPDKLSNSFGLTVGYQILDHFSLNTGLIYTKKNYSADDKDFHPSYSVWPTWSNLEYVTGECNMWEIPLTLRYDFDRMGNTTLFINGGASSYIMTHESYVFYTHYYYSGTSVMRQSPSIPYDTRDGYLFAVLNFSMGAEQDLGKGFSFQVEPFVRIPVQGVGFGNVELSSFGAAFSLRYAPLLKASRK